MADQDSIMAAMDKTDHPSHSVDYYYLEAMRYLTCKDHHSDDSECGCRQCHDDRDDDDDDDYNDHCLGGGSARLSGANENSGGRERSWSHSITQRTDSDKLSDLPDINKGGRLKSRRYSDGMLLKSNMKVSNGHVQWADECKKELTRSRPRKKYERKPSFNTPPRKSILKHSSEESLGLNENDSDSSG